MTELTPKELAKLRKKATGSLYFFCRAILGFDYMVPHVHGDYCRFLEQYARRKRATLPRGFLKTTIGSVGFSLWLALPDGDHVSEWPFRGPDVRILLAYKVIDNGIKTIDQIRGIVDRNELFRALWPELIPGKSNKWSGQTATLNRPGEFREGTYEAAGIGTNVTSRHYDLIIEDDLVAPDKDNLTGLEAMPTREEIEKAIGWHKLARSLLVNLSISAIMNLGTRWAKFDLIQHIIDNEPNTHHFEMSALTPDDQAVYPERFSRAILREIEEEQGTYIFSSQYLNNPYDPASMIFQPEWLHTWDKLPEGMRLVIMVDPAISQEKSACFSVVCVLGAWDQQLYVVDYHRGRYNPSELIDHMFSLSAQYNVMDVAVETVAWQQALAHFFNAECTRRGTFLNVIETKPGAKETKDMRIRGLQPFAQRGALHLAAWMRDLKKEMLDYPFSKTLDIVDAVGYGPRLLGIAYTRAKEQHVPDVHTGLTMGELVDSLRRKGTTRWGMHVGRMPVR